jgi:hypothetical protein
MYWILPAGLILLILSALAVEASAGLRVAARVRTPHLDIRIGNAPGPALAIVRDGCLRPPLRPVHRIDPLDRRIAKRLARYTGVPKGELLQLRRAGYRWIEIGRYLGLSRRAVWAAADARSWQRFLGRAGGGGRPAGCIYDSSEYFRGACHR